MPLITTLQPRDRDVTLADFEETPHLHLETVLNISQSQLVAIWNRWVNYSPQQVSGIFSEAYDHGFELYIYGRSQDELRFEVSRNRRTNDAEAQQQLFDLRSKYIEGSDIVLKKDTQGNGLGRRLSMMFLDLDIALGIEEIFFKAELGVGAYVWGKMGYELDRSGTDLIRDVRYFSQTLLTKLVVLEPFLKSSDYNFATTYARLSNADDLYHLTRMKTDLTGVINSEDFDLEGHLYPVIKESVKDEQEAIMMADRMKKVIEFCTERQQPLTIGKLLLVGESWNAKADYNKDVQMERIIRYGGGLNTSQIITPEMTPEARPSEPFRRGYP